MANDIEINTAEVLNTLLGLNVPYNKNDVYITCPRCKRKKKLNFRLDRGVFRCNKCDYRGNLTTFYADIRGLSTKDAYAEMLTRLQEKHPVAASEMIKIHYESNQENTKLATISERNKTYAAFLNSCTLSKRHMNDLLSRGFDEKFIENRGYKSSDPSANLQTISGKLRQNGYTLEGVPGFYKESAWDFVKLRSGIFVKYLDFNGRIQGIQLRIDDDARKIIDGEKEAKYKWVASGYHKNGTRSTTFIHYAANFVWSSTRKELIPDIHEDVYLTEGAMKGDLFFNLTKQPIISIPGVNCLKQLKPELLRLKSIGVKIIHIAYDMDYLTNPHVLVALSKIKDLIRNCGLSYTQETWDIDNMRNVNGSRYILSAQDTFIFTNETKIERDMDAILTAIDQVGIQHILYAVPSMEEIDEDRMDLIRSLAAEKNICFSPILWALRLKGIDDYYAYKLKGIKR